MNLTIFIQHCISANYIKTCFTTYFLTFSIGISCFAIFTVKKCCAILRS